jgi:hypothetical protein
MCRKQKCREYERTPQELLKDREVCRILSEFLRYAEDD